MSFADALGITAPLFALILLGFCLARLARWPVAVGDALGRFVFGIAIPALLLNLTSDLARLPAIDWRVLIVYFGACLAMFSLARLIGLRALSQDGVAASVFAMGATYGNIVLLGIPLTKSVLGEPAVPTVALVIVFNSVFMWTLATLSVEWARGAGWSPRALARVLKGVLSNPIIAAIACGALLSITGVGLPGPLRTTLGLLGQAAVPLALVTLGMGLAVYEVRGEIREALSIGALKLFVLPAFVWALAHLIGLPPIETQTLVLLSSVPLGVNAYLAAREFGALQGAVSSAVLLSTLASSALMPLLLLMLGGPAKP